MSDKKKRPQFDPTRNYRWNPDDTFELTGQQFASLYHLVSQEANTGAAPARLIMEAYEVVMSVFKEAVAESLIVEQNPAESAVVDEDNVKQLFKK